MPETAEFLSLPVSLSGKQTGEARLRSLRRMGQLAGEIESALRRGDMSLVSQASGLLAPALAQWAEARSPQDADNAEIAHLTREVQQALIACETALSRALSDVQEQQGTVRQHQKRLKQARSHKLPLSRSAGRTLNVSR